LIQLGFAAHASALQSVRLDDDCIRVAVSASAAFQTGTRPLSIALALAERSAYPNAGGFLYVEEGGTDAAEACIGELAAGETDTTLAQKVGQLQPCVAVFPQGCTGQLASFGPS
jgi:hypothetical protein